jgi:hypothetical protein
MVGDAVYDVDLGRPMGSCRKAWRRACKAAGVRYRPHDMRHTFISRLAENPAVSEQTIKALAGHVSRQMLERYSHIRSEAKQAAIQALERASTVPIFDATGHKTGHSAAPAEVDTSAKSLETNDGPARIRTLDQRIMRSAQSTSSNIPGLLLSPSDAASENLQVPAFPFCTPQFAGCLVTAASQHEMRAEVAT